jgi:hypothetical protein
MLQFKVQCSICNHDWDALLGCMIAMMVQHHALTKMVYVMMHDFCRENGIPKSNYCLSFFFKVI